MRVQLKVGNPIDDRPVIEVVFSDVGVVPYIPLSREITSFNRHRTTELPSALVAVLPQLVEAGLHGITASVRLATVRLAFYPVNDMTLQKANAVNLACVRDALSNSPEFEIQ